MPIALEQPPYRKRRFYKEHRVKIWKRAGSFAVNPRGILTHRVKHVVTYLDANGENRHHHVDYWCGNGCCFDVGFEKEVLTDSPPIDRMLCHFCENNAQAKDQPNAGKLAGRHIHRGVLKAHQVCCGGCK